MMMIQSQYVVGATAREVRDGERLEDDAMRIEQAQHARRGYIS